LVCAVIPAVACIAAGSLWGRGPQRWPGADLLVGFGVLATALAMLAVTTPVPLSWLMAALALLFGIGAAVRRQFPGGRCTWIALALVSPILIVAAGHPPAVWDDFWNWLPSAGYAYWHNSLPWPGREPWLSIFPGYPQGMPLMIAAASFLGGRFLEGAGPVINVLLLAGGSAVLAEALAAALVRRGHLQGKELPVVLVAGAVAVTTLFNPGLDGGVLLSSYADCGTMVAVGALGLLGYNVVLLISYLGVMSWNDAHIAADYWRYTPHVALLALYSPVMGLVCARRSATFKPRGAVATLAVVLLALAALPARSDLNDPPYRPWLHFLRDAATQMRETIPRGSKVLIVPYWNSIRSGLPCAMACGCSTIRQSGSTR
jgi:hypothetical protein